MELICLFKNDEWLKRNGLSIDYELIVKAGFGFVEAIFKAVNPFSKDKRANSFIKKLDNLGIDYLDGSIEVDCPKKTKRVIFKDNSGTKYILHPIPGKIWASGIHYPGIVLLGAKTGESKSGQTVISPVVIYQRLRSPEPSRKTGPIPVGVTGLAELLFPNVAPEERGFTKPDAQNVVPRVVIVKGAVGTGKTTLVTQMMLHMAQKGFFCDYWCSNERPQAIKETVTSFRFCDEVSYNKLVKESRISVLEIGSKYLQYLTLASRSDNPIASILARKGLLRTISSLRATDILFFDSLNASQIRKEFDRTALWHLFEGYRRLPLLSFFLLEDYGDDGTEEVRQLISDCEFLADVVIELVENIREGYYAKSLRVKKKHYGEQVYGSHFYKICPVRSSLPDMNPDMNIENRNQNEFSNTGIVVYPSIHRYLSRARIQQDEAFLVNTGITHLDAILVGGSRKKPDIDRGSIESNSCIVICGERGSHKLPLGLNILMGGMWKLNKQGKTKKVVAEKDVLLILLDEEADIHIDQSATARNTHLFTDVRTELDSLDNGKWLRWKKRSHSDHNRRRICPWYNLFGEGMNIGKKVHFNLWCASILNKEGETQDCRKLVIAGFRPGCITPEEFIYIVDRLLNPPGHDELPFSRVLFVSTAHLQNRFPLLGCSKLFVPALVDLFKSRNVISIFTDVQGKGSDKQLSYGLTALADYIIRVDEFSRNYKYHLLFSSKLDEKKKQKTITLLRENSDRYLWARMHIENVRGKEYSRPCHAVTVRPGTKKENDLYIVNAREEEPTLLVFDE